MSRHDLQARPVYHHLTIVFAALAVGRWIEHQTGWPVRRFVKTARRYRTVEIQRPASTPLPRPAPARRPPGSPQPNPRPASSALNCRKARSGLTHTEAASGADNGRVDELRQSWNWQLRAARGFDASCDSDRTWPPPILTALVAAVHDTALRRLHPFTSHARLCLSSGPRCWEPGVRRAPAFVSLDPAGHYNVWSGDPYTSSPALVLETGDARHAAAELEHLLAAWA